MFTRITVLVAFVLLGMSSAMADSRLKFADPVAQGVAGLHDIDVWVIQHRADEAAYCKDNTACRKAFRKAYKAAFAVTAAAFTYINAYDDKVPQHELEKLGVTWDDKSAVMTAAEKALHKYYPPKKPSTVGMK